MRFRSSFAVLFALALISSAFADSPVKNVVVIAMENRSFDHFMGWMKELNPEVNGLTGNEYNPMNTSDPSSPKVYVTKNAVDVGPSPDHSVPASTDQVFGHGRIADMPNKYPALMDGFVTDLTIQGQDGKRAMDCFTAQTLPVMYTLAQEFALFDAFYASVPGPTEVNRAFIWGGTSDGMSGNNNVRLAEGLPNKSIFNVMYEHFAAASEEDEESEQDPFGVYFSDFPTAFFNREVRKLIDHFHPLDDFFTHVADNTLPKLSILEPRYFHFMDTPANDHHPAHNVKLGEILIKKIYESLRASPAWNETLFLITFDEHGGFPDFVPTPLDGVPNPDGKIGTDPPFGFNRLGVRVPFLAISPLIPKGTVVHEPPADVKPQPTSRFSHSSIYATLKSIFGLTTELTNRTAWAAPIDFVVSLDTPRTDTPTTLPNVPDVPSTQDMAYMGDQIIHDFQESMVHVAAYMADQASSDPAILKENADILSSLRRGTLTENVASQFVQSRVALLRRQHQ